MRPDIIVTDELSEKDVESVKKAVNAGVFVFASAHFSSVESVTAAFLGIFDYIVLLDEREIGKIKGIYDKDKRLIC